MDISKLMQRARGIVLSPRTEWPTIAGEAATIRSVYVPHVLVLAAIPALAGFVKGSLIGHGALGIHVRVPVPSGLVGMLVGYGLSLALVYVLALVVDALAPRFDGRKNRLQALKTVAFAWTAAWIAGAAVVVPMFGWLVALLGGAYSIYLLYAGLPHTMRCPKEKSVLYTLVTVVVAVVCSWILAVLVAAVAGAGLSGHGGGNVRVDVDENSRLGALVAMSRHIRATAEAMRGAEEAGAKDGRGGAETARKAYAAMLTGRVDGKPIESLEPDRLKRFLPGSLGDWKRRSLSAEREAGMGIQISTAVADYVRESDGSRIKVSLVDSPSLRRSMRLANAFASELDRQSDHGYEKKYVRDGRRIHEKWNDKRHEGEYGTSLDGRYRIRVSGSVPAMDDLKQVVARLDLDGLVRAGRE